MNVQVIILKTGKVEQVSEGYARNYLIPNKLARIASVADATQAKVQEKNQVVKAVQQAEEWKILSKRLTNLPVVILAKSSPNGTLYERVAASDILSALQSQHQVILQEDWLKLEPIKKVGRSDVKVKFPNSLTSSINVNIKAQ